LASAVVVFCCSVPAAYATSPGQLDPSFGGGTVIAPSGAQLLGVSVRSDGSVVAAGTTGSQAKVAVFSSSGQLQGSFTAAGPVARAVALQSDGKIVIVGGNAIGGGGMMIERLNADGTPDSSFGSGGGGVVNLLSSPDGESDGQANAVTIQPDGKILVAGTALGSDGAPRAAVVRLNSNGSPDSSFAGGGIDIVDLGRYSQVNAMVLAPDGRIMIGGTARADPRATNVVVARLNSNGGLDSSYGNGPGYFAFGFAINNAVTIVNGLALQPDGKVVLAGSAGDSNTGIDMIVFRLTSGGTLDSGFASGGLYRTRATDDTQQYNTFGTASYPVYPGALGVLVLGGKILAAGYYDSFTNDHLALWALTSSGQPDSGFGTQGRALGASGEAFGLTPAPGGNVVVAGQSGSSGLVARYGAPTPGPTSSPPTVTTGSASSVTQVSATVSGTVNPQGLPTTYHFDYGPTTSYGSSTPSVSAGSGQASAPASANLSGLHPGTAYHYQLVASSSAGSSSGGDQTFATTQQSAPSVDSESTSRITEISATVLGPINPNGLATSYHVEYGRASTGESRSHDGSLPAGSTSVKVTVTLRGLRPGTTYHYRLVATNSAGTSSGADMTFATLPRLRASVGRLARSFSLSTISSKGLLVNVGCSQACRIRGSLLISSSLAKRVGLKVRGKTASIGAGSSSLKRTGRSGVRIRLTKTAANQLKGHGRFSATLQIVVSPSAGGPASTISKVVSFTG
jgi:uncharacterized delta-60 repeat protein